MSDSIKCREDLPLELFAVKFELGGIHVMQSEAASKGVVTAARNRGSNPKRYYAVLQWKEIDE